jgi:hypothetical protein
MGESSSQLFGRGLISAKAAMGMKSKPPILRQTRVNRPNEEEFHGRQGLGDQGGADWTKPLDGGDRSVAGTRHIDTRQTMGSPRRASGKPSTGGSAGPQRQPIRVAQIDEGGTQKPDWPKGAGYKGSAGKGKAGNSVNAAFRGSPSGGKAGKPAGWKVPSKLRGTTKSAQMGGAQSAYYGAAGKRP